MSEIKVLAWRFLLGAMRENLVHACLPASGGSRAIFDLPWVVEAAPRLCLHFHMAFHTAFSQDACLYVYISPLYKDICHVALGPTLMTSS